MLADSPSVIVRQFSRLKSNPEWSFADETRTETTAFSHSYHRYPAKFIPQLVRKVVREFTHEGDLVCDPFGGCGTTLVESRMLGRNSIGFDINPVAKLITDTKTKAINPKKLVKARAKFLAAYEKYGHTKMPPVVAHHKRIYYWFNRDMVRRLDRIYKAIFVLKESATRNFFLCAFSHILKNCSHWLMKSIKPTRHPEKVYPNPKEAFLKHLDSMIKKNELYYKHLKETGKLSTRATMQLKDSTKKLPLKGGSVNLVVTSPPYVTSYEYADLHQLSLLWFGDDKKHFKGWSRYSDEFDSFRKEFMGSSFKGTDKTDFGSKIARDIVNRIQKHDKGVANSVARYYVDMYSAFKEMHRVLKEKAKICVIIGNTELNRVPVLNAEVAAEQLSRLGFQRASFVKRDVSSKVIAPWRDKNSGKFTGIDNPSKKRVYQHEYVIIMQKM
jgi:DNA modification methylase